MVGRLVCMTVWAWQGVSTECKWLKCQIAALLHSFAGTSTKQKTLRILYSTKAAASATCLHIILHLLSPGEYIADANSSEFKDALSAAILYWWTVWYTDDPAGLAVSSVITGHYSKALRRASPTETSEDVGSSCLTGTTCTSQGDVTVPVYK